VAGGAFAVYLLVNPVPNPLPGMPLPDRNVIMGVAAALGGVGLLLLLIGIIVWRRAETAARKILNWPRAD